MACLPRTVGEKDGVVPLRKAHGADVLNGPHAVALKQTAGLPLHFALTLRAERMSRSVIEGGNVHQNGRAYDARWTPHGQCTRRCRDC
jgi:hypothetical protein